MYGHATWCVDATGCHTDHRRIRSGPDLHFRYLLAWICYSQNSRDHARRCFVPRKAPAANMRLSATILTALWGFSSAVSAHNILLKAHSRECYYEDLHTDDTMTITFQTGDREFGGSGNLDVNFWVCFWPHHLGDSLISCFTGWRPARATFIWKAVCFVGWVYLHCPCGWPLSLLFREWSLVIKYQGSVLQCPRRCVCTGGGI